MIRVIGIDSVAEVCALAAVPSCYGEYVEHFVCLMTGRYNKSNSGESSVAEGPRDAPCQLKSLKFSLHF